MEVMKYLLVMIIIEGNRFKKKDFRLFLKYQKFCPLIYGLKNIFVTKLQIYFLKKIIFTKKKLFNFLKIV